MPRLKRAQKLARREVKPAPTRVITGVVAEKITSAICPVCGKTIHEKRAIKAGYVTVDHIGYFASIDWDPNKPFGIRQEASGRGSLSNPPEYIEPEQAPELFEAVKARFLAALKEWLGKKWISPADLQDIIG